MRSWAFSVVLNAFSADMYQQPFLRKAVGSRSLGKIFPSKTFQSQVLLSSTETLKGRRLAKLTPRAANAFYRLLPSQPTPPFSTRDPHRATTIPLPLLQECLRTRARLP